MCVCGGGGRKRVVALGTRERGRRQEQNVRCAKKSFLRKKISSDGIFEFPPSEEADQGSPFEAP